MKTIKYILAVLLIIIGITGILKVENFLTSIIFLVLGIILLPPISQKLKSNIKIFNNKKTRYAIYVLILLVGGVFIKKSEAESFGSKKEILVEYIKNSNGDSSLINIKELAKISNMFNHINTSIKYPEQKNYITEKYDSIKKVAVLTFDPMFNFNTNMKFLKEDFQNGKLQNYIVEYEIDKEDNIQLKKTILSYSKGINKSFTSDKILNHKSFLNNDIIEKQRIIKNKKLKEADKKRKFNQIMGDDSFWKTYDPMVKQRVFNMIIQKDCKGLQEEFNIAADRMDVKHSVGRKATRELEFIDFIENKLREIDCH